ncbi:hypothetical protein VULLAG_LOCUS2820 [Vulpes lagopus]
MCLSMCSRHLGCPCACPGVSVLTALLADCRFLQLARTFHFLHLAHSHQGEFLKCKPDQVTPGTPLPSCHLVLKSQVCPLIGQCFPLVVPNTAWGEHSVAFPCLQQHLPICSHFPGQGRDFWHELNHLCT